MRLYGCCDSLFELCAESVYLVRRKSDACGGKMSSISKEMFPAGMDGFVYIKSVDAACAACDDFSAAGKHDCWAIVSFDEPGGYDPDNSFVPVGLKDDSGFPVDMGLVLQEQGQ